MKALLTGLLLLSLWSSGYREGASPTAENLDLWVSRGGTVEGRLQAVDDADEALRYELTTEPVKGELRLQEDGHFVYTADENRRGRDYFGFKAYDSEGNASQEATVIVHIERRGNGGES